MTTDNVIDTYAENLLFNDEQLDDWAGLDFLALNGALIPTVVYNYGYSDLVDIQGIDPTKTYRSCAWVYLPPGAIGTVRLIAQPTVTLNLSGTPNANPYFFDAPIGGGTAVPPGQWYLLVGFIHGSSYGTAPAGIGGIYDPNTGNQVAAATEYKQAAGVTTQAQSVAQLNSNGSGFYACRPRFEEVTGQEPSISRLLSPDGALAYLNQADMSNIVVGAVTNTSITTFAGPDTTVGLNKKYPPIYFPNGVPDANCIIQITLTSDLKLTVSSGDQAELFFLVWWGGYLNGPSNASDIYNTPTAAGSAQRVTLQLRITPYLPQYPFWVDVTYGVSSSGTAVIQNTNVLVEIIKR